MLNNKEEEHTFVSSAHIITDYNFTKLIMLMYVHMYIKPLKSFINTSVLFMFSSCFDTEANILRSIKMVRTIM
jgi:hypothetical protein